MRYSSGRTGLGDFEIIAVMDSVHNHQPFRFSQ
jgi:hypothetical protein